MKIKDSLTVLIPLFGREDLTKRILHYFQEIKLPFKIVMADGGKKPLHDWINDKNYPDLNFQYKYYGEDISIHHYMEKMYNSFKLITSPLLIQVDNDDCICKNGTIYGINFLNKNNQYSSFRETVMSRCRTEGMYQEGNIDLDNNIDRVNESIIRGNCEYHNIMYTHITKIYYELCAKTKTNDLQLVFTFNRLWNSLFGKIWKKNTIPYYYHFPGQSVVQTGVYSKYTNWLQDEKFEDSISILISIFTNAISILNNTNLETNRHTFAQSVCNNIYKRNNVKKIPLNKHIKDSKKYDILIEKTLKNNNIQNLKTYFKLDEEINLNNLKLDYESNEKLVTISPGFSKGNIYNAKYSSYRR